MKKGFTLIELLVVIAIIGILASIVLVALSGARTKAKDAAIQGSMTQLRNAAEMSYSDSLNYSGVCVEAGGDALNSTLTASGDFARIDASVKNNNGNIAVTCNENAGSTGYGAWAPLASTGAWWCVDSTGNSKKLTAAPTTEITVCP